MAMSIVQNAFNACSIRIRIQARATHGGSESLQLTGLDLQASAALPELSAEQRSDMFARFVEPSLQRELKHNGTANGDGSDSAELIGYVELVGPKRS